MTSLDHTFRQNLRAYPSGNTGEKVLENMALGWLVITVETHQLTTLSNEFLILCFLQEQPK
jgi:hypothetical protein